MLSLLFRSDLCQIALIMTHTLITYLIIVSPPYNHALGYSIEIPVYIWLTLTELLLRSYPGSTQVYVKFALALIFPYRNKLHASSALQRCGKIDKRPVA